MEIDCPIPVISVDMNDLWMKSDLDFKKIYAKSAKSARPQRTTTMQFICMPHADKGIKPISL